MSALVKMLILEDDANLSSALERAMVRAGFAVTVANSIAEGRSALATDGVEVFLADFELPDGSSAGLVREALDGRRCQVAYCMTGRASVINVVAAMRAGCSDVFEKPFDPREMAQLILSRHSAFATRPDDLDAWRKKAAPDLVGEHPSLLEVLRVVRNVAATTSTVLIAGESGTGKELIARAVHQGSPRKDKPFVALNCAAIPESLIEAELFGHARGAFTNAVGARDGHLVAAHGGTLFLDEIGDMPLAAQAKLLRVLQERRVTPIGSDRSVAIDVRVIAASNQDLVAAVEAGTFRADLYFRLSVIPVLLPALRDRASDVLALARSFLDQANKCHGRAAASFEPAAERALVEHTWPGNIRELGNTVERAVLMCTRDRIAAHDLGLGFAPRLRLATPAPMPVVAVVAPIAAAPHPVAAAAPSGETLNLRSALDGVERRMIEEALARTAGNRTEAAALLGLNRTTLIEKIRKFS